MNYPFFLKKKKKNQKTKKKWQRLESLKVYELKN
jgi:hypothetical protein